MPTEWQRQSWGAPGSGWPTFGPDGKRVAEEQEDQADEDDE